MFLKLKHVSDLGYASQDFSILNQNLGSLGSNLNRTLRWTMDQANLIMTRLWLNHLSSPHIDITSQPFWSWIWKTENDTGNKEILTLETITLTECMLTLGGYSHAVTCRDPQMSASRRFVTLGFLTSTGMLNFRSLAESLEVKCWTEVIKKSCLSQMFGSCFNA